MSAKDEYAGTGDAAPTKRKRSSSDMAAGSTVGTALRSVYDETVSETIPDDLLDLLGKLS